MRLALTMRFAISQQVGSGVQDVDEFDARDLVVGETLQKVSSIAQS
jgi:hypothetical protein